MKIYNAEKGGETVDIRIGSLNCLNFGLGSSGKKDIDLMRRIILEEKFDIVALQEMKGPLALAQLMNKLPNYWNGVSESEVNDYAYIWNTKRVELAHTKLDNGQIRVFKPHIYKQYKLDKSKGELPIKREPFYARFFTVIPGLPRFEIRVINTHIRFSKGNDGKENVVQIGEKALRKNEFGVLVNSIYSRISDKCYGKQDGEGSAITAYTVLLGDYNLNLPSSGVGAPYVDEIYTVNCGKRDDKSVVTLQSERTTLKKVSETEDNDQTVYASNYDHFSFDKNRFNGTKYSVERIDSVTKYCDNNPEKHTEKISDHVPIKMTLSIKKG